MASALKGAPNVVANGFWVHRVCGVVGLVIAAVRVEEVRYRHDHLGLMAGVQCQLRTAEEGRSISQRVARTREWSEGCHGRIRESGSEGGRIDIAGKSGSEIGDVALSARGEVILIELDVFSHDGGTQAGHVNEIAGLPKAEASTNVDDGFRARNALIQACFFITEQ